MSFLTEIAFAMIRKQISSYNATIIQDSFTIIAVLILAYLFQVIISSNLFRKIVIYSSLVLSAYIVIKLILYKSPAELNDNSTVEFNSINVAILAILVIIWSIIYFYEQLIKPTNSTQLFLYSSPSFWIVTAYLLYFAGTFFLFIYIQQKVLKPGTEFFFQFNLINGVFRLIKNILLTAAMMTKGEGTSRLPSKYVNQPF